MAFAAVFACQSARQSPARTSTDDATAPAHAATGSQSEASSELTLLESGPGSRVWSTRSGMIVHELVTGGAAPDDRLPAVIAIHGLGDDPARFAGLISDLGAPARIFLPRGLDAHEDGWSWFPIRARDPNVESLSAGIVRAAIEIDGAVEILTRERPTAGRPVVTGFSQGGMLAFQLAVAFPAHYAAAIPVGGWLPPPLYPPADRDGMRAGKTPPIVALHGDVDKAVPLAPTQESVTHLRELGIAADLLVYPGVGHQITFEMRAELHARLRLALDEQTASPSTPSAAP